MAWSRYPEAMANREMERPSPAPSGGDRNNGRRLAPSILRSAVRIGARLWLVLALLVATALDVAGAGRQTAPLALLEDVLIAESSGLVASRRNDGVLWTHNDSGEPLLFATDRAGRALGRFLVSGAALADWEDLAIGPGLDGEPALYLADIGDNAKLRDDLAIYRVPEPVVAPSVPVGTLTIGATLPAERLPFTYPDGHHNAETLVVAPETGEMLIITKTIFGRPRVYRFPEPTLPDQPVVVEEVRSARDETHTPRLATGGSVSADGARMIVRTYGAAYEWTVPPGESLAAAILAPPRRVELPEMTQGEAIAYRVDGNALLLTSEGTPCPLYEMIVPRH